MKLGKIGTKILTAMLAASLLAGCSNAAAGRPELLEPVNASLESGLVERRDLSDITIYSAQLLPGFEELGFEYDGYLYGVYVGAGDRVGEGTVLAALVGPDFDAINSLEESIENSKASFEKKFEELELEIELERLAGRNTDELKLQLKHEREKAELTLGEKEARLERLKETDIGYNYITAPCDCTVMAVTKTGAGGYVAAGTPLVAIDYGDEMTLTCDYISEVTVNHAYDCYALIGGVRTDLEYIPYTKEEMKIMSASSIPLVSRFRLKGDTSGFAAGDSAVVVFVSDMQSDVLVVPAGAVYTDSSGKYVYEIVDNARIKRPVVTGITDTAYVEIVEGIEEGALVYVKN
ncbi:MAG: hypothetical protein J5728_03360 [Lachnospiraceae bacterium]|nr:hypothetical protein [Lachnospiraceae bacterium]